MAVSGWKKRFLSAEEKKAMPVMSYPSASLLGMSTRTLLSSAENMAEGMLALHEKYPEGAVFSFMDMSVESEVFGSTVSFYQDAVPGISEPALKTLEEIADLLPPEVYAGRIPVYGEAVRKVSSALPDTPVFACVTGPFSLAASLLGIDRFMPACITAPELIPGLIGIAADFIIEEARYYQSCGASGIFLGDASSCLVSAKMARKLVHPFTAKVTEAVQTEDFPVIYHNCGYAVIKQLDDLSRNGAAAYHIGNGTDPALFLEKFPSDTLILGNIAPFEMFRNGTPDQVYEEALSLLRRFGDYPNFILSSGCDLPFDAKHENIQAFFDAANFSVAMRKKSLAIRL